MTHPGAIHLTNAAASRVDPAARRLRTAAFWAVQDNPIMAEVMGTSVEPLRLTRDPKYGWILYGTTALGEHLTVWIEGDRIRAAYRADTYSVEACRSLPPYLRQGAPDAPAP